MAKKLLTVSHCAKCGVWALVGNEVDPDGSGSGRRFTQRKCCGSWPTAAEWSIEQLDRKELVEFLGGSWPEFSSE